MPDSEETERTRTITWADPSEVVHHVRRLSGADLMEKMRLGEIPEPPFAKLLGIEVFDAGEGTVTMTLPPQEMHYNPMGCVHGGILSTLLDTVMSAAIHSVLPAGRGYLTLSLNVNFLRPVYEHTGEIMAQGQVVSMGRQIATAEGRVMDVKGNVCATGTATCLLMDIGRRKPEAEPKVD